MGYSWTRYYEWRNGILFSRYGNNFRIISFMEILGYFLLYSIKILFNSMFSRIYINFIWSLLAYAWRFSNKMVFNIKKKFNGNASFSIFIRNGKYELGWSFNPSFFTN